MEYDFSIAPELPFTVIQNGADTELWFSTPADPEMTYTLTARPIDTDHAAQQAQWQFTPRRPDVIYMVLQEQGSDLWVTSLENPQSRKLTSTNGGIQDYAVSPGGEQIVFSVINSQTGFDLWTIDRNGENMLQTQTCGPDTCTDVAFLPSSGDYAFVQNSRTDTGEVVSRIWLKKSGSQEAQVLYEQSGGGVSDLKWSPDGSMLAFVNETRFQIQFLFLDNLKVSVVDCESSETGGWSTDGSQMVFACTGSEQDSPCKDLKEVNPLTLKITDSPLQELNGQRDYSAPVWSLDGKWIVFGERCYSDRPTRQLWLVDAQTQKGEQITNEPLYNFANYHWDPFSQIMVLQRYEMGSASAAPDVMLWKLSTEELELLAEGGHSPQWLP